MYIQFPIKGSYSITQHYSDTNSRYVEPSNPKGEHRGTDVVPLDENYHAYPANLYAPLSGAEVMIADTDMKRGKGVRVRSEIDLDFITFLKSIDYIPSSYSGRVFLEILQWHCLDVIDEDGTVDQVTPIAICGNSGWVFSDGGQVPDNKKGVPPYPGLHVHIEAVVKGENETFNLDKDSRGRVDFMKIIKYQPSKEEDMTILQIEGEQTLVVKMNSGYYRVATEPELFPLVARILGLEVRTEYPKVSKAEVDANDKGFLKATLSFVEK